MDIQIETDKMIRLLEERLLQTNVRHSVNEIDELLADEFIEFGSTGRIFNKKQVIEALQMEAPQQLSLTEFKTINLAPEVILTRYIAVKQEQDGQKVYSLRSSLWKLIDDRWQMIFHQGTVTKPELPQP
jgi:hypothetical protein